jgi:ribosomal-protein-alanine N-acetyltransferase
MSGLQASPIMDIFRFPDVIETDDLLLRAPVPDDAPALFDEMFGDGDMMRDLPMVLHRSVEDSQRFVEESERGWREGTLIRWVLEDKETKRLTAVIELRPQLPRIEVGTIISRHGGARRRRAGLYALRKLLKWLLAQPPVFRIYAYCAIDGKAYSTMERLGFALEATVKNHECRPNRGLPAADSYLFAMTRPVQPPSVASPLAGWLPSLLE